MAERSGGGERGGGPPPHPTGSGVAGGPPLAVARRSVHSGPDTTSRGDPGGVLPPREVARRIRSTEKTANAFTGRYSDELLGVRPSNAPGWPPQGLPPPEFFG